METAPTPGVRPPAEIRNLVELLRFRATTAPAHRAYGWLVDGDTEQLDITYGELDRRARAIAATLQERHAPGTRALLLYPPGLDYIAAYFGCLYAGVVAVPAYPPRPNKTSHRLQAIVTGARATVALTVDAIMQKLSPRLSAQPALAALQWLTTDKALPADPGAWRMPDLSADTLAFLQYSSGTTGAPRGVMVTHGNLRANADLIAEGFEHAAGDHSVFWLPVYHDMGLIGGVLQPLWLGAPSTLMAPAAFLQKPFRWLHAISRLHATVSGGPDMAYDLCARQVTEEQKRSLDLSSWTLAFTGAEPIRPATLQRFSEAFRPCGFDPRAFYACYGLAEGTLMVTGTRRMAGLPARVFTRTALHQGRALPMDAPGDDVAFSVGSGRVLLSQDVRIVDAETREVLPEGRVGEIWVRGPCVSPGFFGADEDTERHLRATLVDGVGPFLRTRDTGFMHAGELHVTGRTADTLVLGDRRIPAHDVEQAAEGVSGLLKQGFGACFQVEREGRVTTVLLFEQERHHKADPAAVLPEVVAHVRRTLDVSLDVVGLVRLLGIPKTSSGKIQRFAAREAWLAQALPMTGQWSVDAGFHVPARAVARDDDE